MNNEMLINGVRVLIRWPKQKFWLNNISIRCNSGDLIALLNSLLITMIYHLLPSVHCGILDLALMSQFCGEFIG